MKFLDQVKIYVKAGNGGHGSPSFRREKFIEYGGPDGGDGGKGGTIFLRSERNLNTLIDYRYRQHFKAGRGLDGSGRNRTGHGGDDVTLRIPVGTQVFEEDKQSLLADLTKIGQRACLTKGGNGGFGNTHFKSSTNQAPRTANPGAPGEEFWIWLRLKLIADVGLVGLPNAGKSTFLAAVSRAKPKIADYPFTTLAPNLGVTSVDGAEFVIADIPGLIKGAHEGAGLGTRFLGHVERCGVLLHLIDVNQDDTIGAYKTIRSELENYDKNLASKPELIALSKSDTLAPEKLEQSKSDLSDAIGKDVIILSAASGAGVEDVLRQLRSIFVETRRHEKAHKTIPPTWRPN